MLNAIDDRLRALRGKNDAASAAKRGELAALLARLTSNPQHDEDTIGRPNKIREQLQGVAGTIGASFQPPNAAESADAQTVMARYAAAIADARRVLGS
jgi:hypothetical protein